MQLTKPKGWKNCNQEVNLQRLFYSSLPDWWELAAFKGPDHFHLFPFCVITAPPPCFQQCTPALAIAQSLCKLPPAPTSEPRSAWDTGSDCMHDALRQEHSAGRERWRQNHAALFFSISSPFSCFINGLSNKLRICSINNGQPSNKLELLFIYQVTATQC